MDSNDDLYDRTLSSKRGLFSSSPFPLSSPSPSPSPSSSSSSSLSGTPIRSALHRTTSDGQTNRLKRKKSVRFSGLSIGSDNENGETNGHGDGNGTNEKEHGEEMEMETEKETKRMKPSEKVGGKRLVKLNPYGVLPMGNYFIDCTSPTFVDARQIGLGILSCLPDNVFSFILNELNAEDLSKLALVSKAFYVHVNEDDELWKFFTVAEFGGDFRFRNGTWQETFKAARIERRLRQLFASSSSSTSSTSVPSLIEKEAQENFILKEVNRLVPPHIPIRVSGFYSDLLHHAWSCRSAWLQQWALAPDTIERRSALTMSREDFERDYLIPNKPVVITDLVTQWPCFLRSSPLHWSASNLLSRFAETTVKINQGVEMKMKDYLHYCSTTKEENPMYLFDNEYGEKCPEMLNEYWVPDPIKNRDLFELLPSWIRPSYRWILVGPSISGATFHKDPNSTSAWNGLIYGAKKWIMYPPEVTPPGIYASEDGWEVTTPVSSIEWFHNFYAHKARTESGVKPLEVIQKPGELVFIPNGWWHSVLNLEESIAVTQNFVSRHNLYNVLDFLRRKKKKELCTTFETLLEQHHPGLIAEVEAEAKLRPSSSSSSCSVAKRGPSSIWEQLKAPSTEELSLSSSSSSSATEGGAFSFSFSF